MKQCIKCGCDVKLTRSYGNNRMSIEKSWKHCEKSMYCKGILHRTCNEHGCREPSALN